MHICLIEPFFSGSHQRWASELQHSSSHEITLFTLPGRHWKWRMHGAAISMAEQYLKSEKGFDLIVVSDMLDLSLFSALVKKKAAHLPVILYFHENQLTYPWSPDDPDLALERDNHYAFINYSSSLAADYICFNSNYHRHSFLESLPAFLQAFPDHKGLENIEIIRAKSDKLPLGLQLKSLDKYKTLTSEEEPIILWNHRWEYDKDPETFFNLLLRLKKEGIVFKLVVLGEGYQKCPLVFHRAKEELADELLHWGFVATRSVYAKWLWRANILPVTSKQDFFGGSVVEAIYCGCYPLLPNRLAYPEHIPVELQSEHLYSNEEDLYYRLKMVIEKLIYRQTPKELQNFVAYYDWSNLAPRYDQLFSSFNQI